MSNSLQPHGLEPARLLCPWHFPGRIKQQFLGFDTESIDNKRKYIYKLDFIKSSLKLLRIKSHYQECEKQLTEWEKILANHLSDKGLIP